MNYNLELVIVNLALHYFSQKYRLIYQKKILTVFSIILSRASYFLSKLFCIKKTTSGYIFSPWSGTQVLTIFYDFIIFINYIKVFNNISSKN